MTKALWLLHLPKGSDLLVKKGDRINPGEPLAKVGKEVFKSPTGGEVVDIEGDKISLTFKTEKIEGKGFFGGRCWGELVFAPETGFSDLTAFDQGKIVFVENLDRLLAVKAAAIGVCGFVCFSCQSIGEKNLTLPVLVIENDKSLLLLLERVKGVKCLLDAEHNCLLIPR